ncbi:MAG: hypothetical protein Q8P18_10370 [Pseudomonadota bacterium]|nr:hypothetical protein [Pseudomonadota bacterium]
MGTPYRLVRASVLAVALGWAGRADAGNLDIRSAGAEIVVMSGSELAGTTPLVLHDVKGLRVELGFRGSTFAATVFTQWVYVPEMGTAYLTVDLPERTATRTMPPADAEPIAAPVSALPEAPLVTASAPSLAPAPPPVPSVTAPTQASIATANLQAAIRAAPPQRNATPLRLIVNASVTAIGAAGALVGAADFAAAGEAFGRYRAAERDTVAERIYVLEVEPKRTQGYIIGGTGMVALMAATGLWVTTRF